MKDVEGAEESHFGRVSSDQEREADSGANEPVRNTDAHLGKRGRKGGDGGVEM